MPRVGLDKSKLIERAAQLADSEGLEAINARRLAESFGIRPPSLYKHVQNLDEVLAELHLMGLRQLGARIREAAVGIAGDGAIKALCLAYRDFARQHPGLYQAMQSTHVDKRPDIVQAGEDTMMVLFQVLAYYELPTDRAIDTARALRSLLHGFVDLELRNGFGLNRPIDQSFLFAVEQLITGIAHHQG